jgi:quercetin dioxygenase-like cupin family protein
MSIEGRKSHRDNEFRQQSVPRQLDAHREPAPSFAMSVEFVEHGGRQLAVILRVGGGEPGTRFVTGPDAPLQLGEINRPAGDRIPAHAHNLGVRTITETHEFLHVLSGRLKVDLYGEQTSPVATRLLTAGDTILLTAGAHGFEFITPCHLIEVKQGPYLGEQDKTYL